MQIIHTHDDIAAGLNGLMMLDARLIPVVEKAGPVPLRRTPPGFASLADIIVSQMVSKASARAIWQRLEQVCGMVTPEAVLGLDEEASRRIGLSRAKFSTLQAAAHAVVSGALDLNAVCEIEPALAISSLTRIRGIGRWSAQVYLVFCAGHPDIFPVGDVALQNAVGHGLSLGMRPSLVELDVVSAAWSPWRSVAARLFWAYYARQIRRDSGV